MSVLVSSATLVPTAPGGAFKANEPVSFSCYGECPQEWRLQDWRGTDVRQVRLDGARTIENPGTGYWKLVAGTNAVTFAVVGDPSVRAAECGFFAVDSAQSWCASKKMFDCPWYGGDTYRAVTEILRRAGIRHVRDRMGWGHVKKTAESPVKGDRYGKNADLLAAVGIRISSVFHDAPAYADVAGLLPRELAATRDFCRDVARFFGDKVEMWEFWNEPDIFFAEAPVWDYAAAFKAGALGYRAGNPKAIVANAAFANAILSPYGDGLAENGVWSYSDVLNWHTYADLKDYPKLYAEKAAYLRKHGVRDLASVLTECGTNQEGDSDGDGAQKGKKAHSPKQELVHAEFLPKSMITHQMFGSWRDYFFMFGVLNERDGKKDWGIMRRDGLVKPAYAALATLTEYAGDKVLLGETKFAEGVRTYVYSNKDGRQTLVAWTESELDTQKGVVTADNLWPRTVRIPVRAVPQRMADMCGRVLKPVVANGVLTLELTRYPMYVEGWLGLVAATPCAVPAIPVRRPESDTEDLTLIVRADFAKDDWYIHESKAKAIWTNGVGRLTLSVWNLSERSKSVALDVTGVRLVGIPPAVTVPADGKVEISASCAAETTGEAVLKVVAVADGRRSAPLAVPFERRARLVPSSKAVRFGILSDTHVSHDDPKTARVELKNALAHFRAQKVDAVVHCGDLTNLGYRDELALFAEIWKSEMPTSLPLIAVWGNRDMSDTGRISADVLARDAAKLIYTDAAKALRESFGLAPWDGVRGYEVKGVRVIAADWKQQSRTEEFLDAHEAFRNPRPFMIHVQHLPPKGLGARLTGKDEAEPVTCALNMYPNVISLSGHSHATFTKGGQFHRHFFTAAGAGCHYLAAGPDRHRREVMVLTLDGDVAELVRRDLRTGYEDVRQWTRDTTFDVKPLARAKGSLRFVQWNAYGFRRGSSGERQATLDALDADWVGISEFAPKADGGKIAKTLFGAYPSVSFVPKKGANCNAVVSRMKPVGVARPQPFAKSRAERYWLQGEYAVAGRTTTVFQTHLDLTEERKAEIAELLKAASACPYAIVAGDFNIEKADELAAFEAAGFVRANNGSFGELRTHRKRKTSFTPAIDDVLVKGFDIVRAFTFDDACRLSDHRMLVADLEFKKEE